MFLFTSYHILPCLSIVVIAHAACNTNAHNVQVYAKTRTGNAGVSLLWAVFQCWYIRYTCKEGQPSAPLEQRSGYSLILARSLSHISTRPEVRTVFRASTYSWSLNKLYSSSPTLMGLPPN
jgi:hypothetical protein